MFTHDLIFTSVHKKTGIYNPMPVKTAKSIAIAKKIFYCPQSHLRQSQYDFCFDKRFVPTETSIHDAY